MFYLTTHSTHFIYGYMVSDILLRTILIVRKETRCRHIGYSYRLTARVLLYAPSHRHTTAFVTPVVEHWLEREIALWVRWTKSSANGLVGSGGRGLGLMVNKVYLNNEALNWDELYQACTVISAEMGYKDVCKYYLTGSVMAIQMGNKILLKTPIAPHKYNTQTNKINALFN